MSSNPPQRPLSGNPTNEESTPERKKPFFDFSAAQFSVVEDDPQQTAKMQSELLEPTESKQVTPPESPRKTTPIASDEPRLTIFHADEPVVPKALEPQAEVKPKSNEKPLWSVGLPASEKESNTTEARQNNSNLGNGNSQSYKQVIDKQSVDSIQSASQTNLTFWKYLRSKAFFRFVAIVAGTGLTIAFLLFWVLIPLITRYNDAVTVPDITNKSFDEAVALLDEAGLRYEVIDSQYVEGITKTIILTQTPQSLDRVKPGRTVYLSLSKSTVPKVKLPDVKGKYLNVASSMLRNWNFKVGKIEYTYGQYKEQVLELKVNGKNVDAGEPLPSGTYVDLVVSRGKGYGGKAKSPNFVGMKLEEAMKIIDELGLSLQDVKYQTNKKYGTGVVFKQIPAYSPKDSLSQGAEIYLYVSGVGPGSE